MSHCGVPGFPPKNYRQTLHCRLLISVGVLVVKSVMLAYLPDNWHFFRFMKGAWCYVSLSTTRNKDFDNFNIVLIFCDSFDNSYNFDNENPRDLWPNSDETYALIECCKQRVSNSLTPETVWSHAG